MSIMAHTQMTEKEKHYKVNGLVKWGPPDQWKTMEKARDWACKFVTDLEEGRIPTWGVLIGGYGCGKTHLMCGMANALVARGIPTVMVYVTSLLNELKGTFNGNGNETNEFLEEITAVKVLMIDDFGTEQRTPWSTSILEHIINSRYKEAEEKPTVISTNKTIQQLKALYPRIASRVMDSDISTVHVIAVGDYRLRKGVR